MINICWVGKQLILYILKVYLVIGIMFAASCVVTEWGWKHASHGRRSHKGTEKP